MGNQENTGSVADADAAATSNNSNSSTATGLNPTAQSLGPKLAPSESLDPREPQSNNSESEVEALARKIEERQRSKGGIPSSTSKTGSFAEKHDFLSDEEKALRSQRLEGRSLLPKVDNGPAAGSKIKAHLPKSESDQTNKIQQQKKVLIPKSAKPTGSIVQKFVVAPLRVAVIGTLATSIIGSFIATPLLVYLANKDKVDVEIQRMLGTIPTSVVAEQQMGIMENIADADTTAPADPIPSPAADSISPDLATPLPVGFPEATSTGDISTVAAENKILAVETDAKLVPPNSALKPEQGAITPEQRKGSGVENITFKTDTVCYGWNSVNGKRSTEIEGFISDNRGQITQKSDKTEFLSFLVYLPKSLTDDKSELENLKRKGVTDTIRINDAQFSGVLSLGLFKTETAALKQKKIIESKGISGVVVGPRSTQQFVDYKVSFPNDTKLQSAIQSFKKLKVGEIEPIKCN